MDLQPRKHVRASMIRCHLISFISENPHRLAGCLIRFSSTQGPRCSKTPLPLGVRCAEDGSYTALGESATWHFQHGIIGLDAQRPFVLVLSLVGGTERCLLPSLVATICSAARDTPAEHARAACVSLRRDRGNWGRGGVCAFPPCLLRFKRPDVFSWNLYDCMNLSPLGLDTEKLRKFGSLSVSAWL